MKEDINIDLTHILAFREVAEKLNFKRASESLHMTQPGLTRMIKRLEEDIGAKLFSRTTRNVELTDAGIVFLREIDPVIQKIKTAINYAKSAESGNVGYLIIGYMAFAINGLLPTILRDFNENYPRINANLVYAPTKDQKRMILDSELDIGFLIGDFTPPGVEQITIAKEKLVVILPEDHTYREKSQLSLQDLANEEFILGSQKNWSSFSPIIIDLCHQADFNPKIRQYVDTSEGIFGLVAAGLGVTIYTESAFNVRSRGIIIRPLLDETAEIKTVAAWLKKNESPSLSKFIKIIEKFSVT